MSPLSQLKATVLYSPWMSLNVAVIATKGDRFTRSVWRACVLLSADPGLDFSSESPYYATLYYATINILPAGRGGFSLIEMDVNFPLYIEPGEFSIHFCQCYSFI